MAYLYRTESQQKEYQNKVTLIRAGVKAELKRWAEAHSEVKVEIKTGGLDGSDYFVIDGICIPLSIREWGKEEAQVWVGYPSKHADARTGKKNFPFADIVGKIVNRAAREKAENEKREHDENASQVTLEKLKEKGLEGYNWNEPFNLTKQSNGRVDFEFNVNFDRAADMIRMLEVANELPSSYGSVQLKLSFESEHVRALFPLVELARQLKKEKENG